MMRDFTHYDLHEENILLYTMPQDKYVEMNYMDTGVTFKTKYIVKIIDYGRSFYRGNTVFFNILNKVCPNAEKNRDGGFQFTNKIANKNNYYITARLNNISHDLRCAYMIWNIIGKSRGANTKNIREILGNIHYSNDYGTPSKESDIDIDPTIVNRIYNVGDLERELTRYLLGNYFKTSQEDAVKFPPNNKFKIINV
jgi:hypothetical protein